MILIRYGQTTYPVLLTFEYDPERVDQCYSAMVYEQDATDPLVMHERPEVGSTPWPEPTIERAVEALALDIYDKLP